jgi:predicted transcriptional regulator
MKNITITLPDAVSRKTRILAAEAETSVSQYLCRLVTEKIEGETKYQAAMTRFLRREAHPLQATPAPYPTRDSLHDRHAFR